MSLNQCNNDLSQHLSRCHLSQKQIREAGLILARSGLFYTIEAQSGEMFFCPKHRAYLGQYWGNQTKSRSCKYPEGECKAAKTDRAFTLRVSREVMEMFGVLVPVGAREYLPLIFSVTFYLKELRLMNSSLNERLFSSLGMIFSALCNSCRKAHYKRAQSQKPQCESDAVLPTRYLHKLVCFFKHDVQLKTRLSSVVFIVRMQFC